MLTERRQGTVTGISWVAALCFTLGGFLASCDRPPASDSTASSSAPAPNEVITPGAVLRADPNPVPPGTPNGRTTITWDTGSDDIGDVYVVAGRSERLFSNGSRGSQEAPWIQPGSNEFRLYNHADHKLIAQLIVTMPSSDVSVNKQPATAVLTATP
jgi:hypothetical protein